jgi:glucose/mannose-6-phosphate isomerase
VSERASSGRKGNLRGTAPPAVPPRDLPGYVRMRALAEELPASLEQGFRWGRELALPNGERPSAVYAIGMGGSAIGADLARAIVEPETERSLHVVRAPELPRSVDARSQTILLSYSGNTWETIRAYELAGRAGAPRTVIASGGTLAERAESDGVPVLRVPPGLPPRAAVGYFLGGVLGLLDPAFPESNESRIALVAERVRARIGEYSRTGSAAAALAEGIGERLPFVYAASGFGALAQRWSTQIEENAKRLAIFDEAPELFHGALVGWDATSRTEASRLAVVLIEWSRSDPTIVSGLRYLERLLRGRSVKVLRAALAPDDRLEAIVEGVALGDFVSLYLARRRHADPYPIDALTRMRDAIVPSEGPARPGRTDPGRAAPARRHRRG